MMTSRFGVVAATGALVGIIAALLVANHQGATPTKPPAATGTAQIGGPFSLLKTDGTAVSNTDYIGKPLLVYFGFTNCPDICPAGLQVISSALDTVGTDADKLSVVFISLDPERDTPAKLGAYMKSFHPAIQGLTGSLDGTTAAAKAYRVYFKKVPSDTTPGDYSIDHSGFMYLMNKDGIYAQHFPHNVAAEKLATAISKAIKPAP